VQMAPMLQHIKESWPGSGPNKVRLPGGKYVKPGFSAWCKLHDAHGARIAEDGQSAARALLAYQTPAELVPESLEPEDVAQEMSRSVGQQAPTCSAKNGTSSRGVMQPGVDQYWQDKYGRYHWFQFTSAQLAAWYNARHAVQEILPPEQNGMGLASWRGERTASIGYTRDGIGWVDFGASAAQPDGKRDGGDSLELAARITQETKPAVMRQAARALVNEARKVMESAARDGQLPSAWVQAFMSPAGWERYEHLYQEYVHQGQLSSVPPTPGATIQAQEQEVRAKNKHAEDAGGVGGSCAQSPAYDTPEALAAELGAEIGEPCTRCGCTLHYQSGPYVMCHQCHPRPLRLGGLNDEQWRRLRTLFPRRAQTAWRIADEVIAAAQDV